MSDQTYQYPSITFFDSDLNAFMSDPAPETTFSGYFSGYEAWSDEGHDVISLQDSKMSDTGSRGSSHLTASQRSSRSASPLANPEESKVSKKTRFSHAARQIESWLNNPKYPNRRSDFADMVADGTSMKKLTKFLADKGVKVGERSVKRYIEHSTNDDLRRPAKGGSTHDTDAVPTTTSSASPLRLADVDPASCVGEDEVLTINDAADTGDGDPALGLCPIGCQCSDFCKQLWDIG